MNSNSSEPKPIADPNERRREPRVHALYHVIITADGTSREVDMTVGRTLDVSAAGVRVETPGLLGVDDQVRLEIAVEETLIDARGRVVRVARVGRLIEAGIEFTSITDSDRAELQKLS